MEINLTMWIGLAVVVFALVAIGFMIGRAV